MNESDETSTRIMGLAIGAITCFVGGIVIANEIGIIAGLPIFLSGTLPSAGIYSINKGPRAKTVMAIASVITLMSWCGIAFLVVLAG